MIEVRECRTFEELDACVELQREAFGYSDLEISPRRYLILSHRSGGWTLGAFDAGGGLVGFVHHLVAVRAPDEIIGYSHMMAVAPDYQNRGVGALLKWAQRARTLAEGRSYITWTWNPMQARNAHFNLNRLGVTASSYAANFYGTERATTTTAVPSAHDAEGVAAGIDTDRLFADWDLRSERVAKLAEGRDPHSPSDPVQTIEIPADWKALLQQDAAAARREQQRVRSEFQKAFAAGLICAGFERDGTHPRYLLYESKV